MKNDSIKVQPRIYAVFVFELGNECKISKR